jgi:hypothetical protein
MPNPLTSILVALVLAQVNAVVSNVVTLDLVNDPVMVGIIGVAATTFNLNVPVYEEVPAKFLAVQFTDCTPNAGGAVIALEPDSAVLLIPKPLNTREDALIEFQVKVVTVPGLTVYGLKEPVTFGILSIVMLILFVAIFPVLLVAVTTRVYILPDIEGAVTVAEPTNWVEFMPKAALTIVALDASVIVQLNLTDAPGATVPPGTDEITIDGIIAVVDDTVTEIISVVTSFVELVASSVTKYVPGVDGANATACPLINELVNNPVIFITATSVEVQFNVIGVPTTTAVEGETVAVIVGTIAPVGGLIINEVIKL